MKKVLWVMMLILLTSLVSASHSIFVKDSLEEGEAKAYQTDNGVYIIELMIVSGNEAKFKVNNQILKTLIDGESDRLDDKSELIVKKVLNSETDEVEFYFFGSGNEPLDIKLEERWEIEDCNFDGICQENETKALCCQDCSCESGYKCEENKCVKKEGCSDDDECDDSNPCTTDSCENSKCVYDENEGCGLDGECVAYGTIEKTDDSNSYCSEDGWKDQQEANEECNNDYECLSDSCKNNECYVRSLRGFFTVIVLIIILSVIFYAGKKGNVHKKIQKRLFWKF